MNEKSMEIRNKAGNYFRQGFNCAESILKAFMDTHFTDMPSSITKLATPFGGGLGRAGCICGALAGSSMVIGLAKGRASADEDKDLVYGLSKEFQERFQDKFGATCCRVLNGTDFVSKEHLKKCLKITGTTGVLLSDFLQEKEIL